MNFIDTHSHLYSTEFDIDIVDVINRSKAIGINKIFLPNVDSESILPLKELILKDSDLFYPMMGLHPCSVKENFEEELEVIKKELFNNKYYAVGEIGIDLFWDKTFLANQQRAFKEQINWAKDLKLPIVIHARDSFDEIFKIVDQEYDSNVRGIFHCFTGTADQAQKIIDYGTFKLGIGGVVTYKNSGLDKTLQAIGHQHLVLETDAPYLSPQPYRGKRNESAYIEIIAKKIAEILNVDVSEIAETTNRNAHEIFQF
jgi:TatD DNase family protein